MDACSARYCIQLKPQASFALVWCLATSSFRPKGTFFFRVSKRLSFWFPWGLMSPKSPALACQSLWRLIRQPTNISEFFFFYVTLLFLSKLCDRFSTCTLLWYCIMFGIFVGLQQIQKFWKDILDDASFSVFCHLKF